MVTVLESTMSEDEFSTFIGKMIEEARTVNSMIFSVADTCPPQAPFHRIKYLTERLRNA